MKRLLFIVLLSIILIGCASTEYIEVPQIKIEYRDRVSIDTLLLRDSIVTKEKGDTIILEKYKYLYRTKEVRDTINITDTTTVIKTIEVTKEVNKLYNWQIILMVLGGAVIVLLIYKLIKLIKT